MSTTPKRTTLTNYLTKKKDKSKSFVQKTPIHPPSTEKDSNSAINTATFKSDNTLRKSLKDSFVPSTTAGSSSTSYL